MKQQTEVTLRLSEELLRRAEYVAAAEGQTLNNYLTMLLRNNIQYFERAKGKIPNNLGK